jgi:hypothetical protein
MVPRGEGGLDAVGALLSLLLLGGGRHSGHRV